MKRSLFLMAAAAAASVGVLNATPAMALPARTFVSGLGADTGTCPVTAPCRSFAYAITQTAAGGEIVVLNSAGYGTVTIGQAISITNEEGVEAAVTVTSGDGITINAGANDTVNLTGLTLTGTGSGGTSGNGITFKTGNTLNIENCVMRGFGGAGLNLVPTTAGAQINVSDVIVADNGDQGILFQPTVSATGYFQRLQVLHNLSEGVLIDATNATTGTTINATVADSVSSGNDTGYDANGISGVQPTLLVVNSRATRNGVGIEAQGGTVILAKTAIFGNNGGSGFSIGASPSKIKTYGDNYIADTANGGTLTSISAE